MTMRKKKKYIVEIKHWWDKVNGNSYFSGRVYDLRMDVLYFIPFQYGDTSHSEDVAVNCLGSIHKEHMHKHDISRLCYFNHQDTLKKWVKQYGEEPEDFDYIAQYQ